MHSNELNGYLSFIENIDKFLQNEFFASLSSLSKAFLSDDMLNDKDRLNSDLLDEASSLAGKHPDDLFPPMTIGLKSNPDFQKNDNSVNASFRDDDTLSQKALVISALVQRLCQEVNFSAQEHYSQLSQYEAQCDAKLSSIRSTTNRVERDVEEKRKQWSLSISEIFETNNGSKDICKELSVGEVTLPPRARLRQDFDLISATSLQCLQQINSNNGEEANDVEKNLDISTFFQFFAPENVIDLEKCSFRKDTKSTNSTDSESEVKVGCSELELHGISPETALSNSTAVFQRLLSMSSSMSQQHLLRAVRGGKIALNFLTMLFLRQSQAREEGPETHSSFLLSTADTPFSSGFSLQVMSCYISLLSLQLLTLLLTKAKEIQVSTTLSLSSELRCIMQFHAFLGDSFNNTDNVNIVIASSSCAEKESQGATEREVDSVMNADGKAETKPSTCSCLCFLPQRPQQGQLTSQRFSLGEVSSESEEALVAPIQQIEDFFSESDHPSSGEMIKSRAISDTYHVGLQGLTSTDISFSDFPTDSSRRGSQHLCSQRHSHTSRLSNADDTRNSTRHTEGRTASLYSTANFPPLSSLFSRFAAPFLPQNSSSSGERPLQGRNEGLFSPVSASLSPIFLTTSSLPPPYPLSSKSPVQVHRNTINGRHSVVSERDFNEPFQPYGIVHGGVSHLTTTPSPFSSSSRGRHLDSRNSGTPSMTSSFDGSEKRTTLASSSASNFYLHPVTPCAEYFMRSQLLLLYRQTISQHQQDCLKISSAHQAMQKEIQRGCLESQNNTTPTSVSATTEQSHVRGLLSFFDVIGAEELKSSHASFLVICASHPNAMAAIASFLPVSTVTSLIYSLDEKENDEDSLSSLEKTPNVSIKAAEMAKTLSTAMTQTPTRCASRSFAFSKAGMLSISLPLSAIRYAARFNIQFNPALWRQLAQTASRQARESEQKAIEAEAYLSLMNALPTEVTLTVLRPKTNSTTPTTYAVASTLSGSGSPLDSNSSNQSWLSRRNYNVAVGVVLEEVVHVLQEKVKEVQSAYEDAFALQKTQEMAKVLIAQQTKTEKTALEKHLTQYDRLLATAAALKQKNDVLLQENVEAEKRVEKQQQMRKDAKDRAASGLQHFERQKWMLVHSIHSAMPTMVGVSMEDGPYTASPSTAISPQSSIKSNRSTSFDSVSTRAGANASRGSGMRTIPDFSNVDFESEEDVQMQYDSLLHGDTSVESPYSNQGRKTKGSVSIPLQAENTMAGLHSPAISVDDFSPQSISRTPGSSVPQTVAEVKERYDQIIDSMKKNKKNLIRSVKSLRKTIEEEERQTKQIQDFLKQKGIEFAYRPSTNQ